MRRTSGRASSTSRARPSTLLGFDARRELADQVFGERLGVRQPGLERRLAFLAHERVGVVAVGQEQEADLPALLDLADRVLERAPRRGATRAVAVEAEHDLADEPEDALQVLGRRRGAERGDRVRDPGLVQAHDVHVALDHQQSLQAARRLPRLVEAVQLAALVEQLGLGRIQVLGLALVEHAPAEADRAAARVADREHEPVAETVVMTAFAAGDRSPGAARVGLALDDEAGAQQHVALVLGRAVALEQAVPPRRGIADAELLHARRRRGRVA